MDPIVIAALVFLVVVIALVTFALRLKTVTEEKMPYILKRYFFSRSEMIFFQELQKQLDHSKYAVFPKVRIADFVEVDLPKGERMQYWNKIKSKHVDFLVYEYQTGKPVMGIELDGSSHTNQAVQKSDDFKDKLYPVLKLELVRVRVGNDFAEEVNAAIQKLS